MEWINVKDDLPETNDEVLITYCYEDSPKKRYVETASYWDYDDDEGHWTSVWDEFSTSRKRKIVVAWMFLPKPYRGEI